jgi:dipeptidyl aminopeptidase/acylaminoacyl peptidase
MITSLFAALVFQAASVPARPDEPHLRHLRRLTNGGQNAEAYYSHDGARLIFQHTPPPDTAGCDQEFIIHVDGSGLRRVSDGQGRTTCGWFFAGDRRVFYASTEAVGPACPPRPDYSHGYVWALYDYDIYASDADGGHKIRLTANPGYDAEGTLSPDGKTIVFTSERDGDLDIYTMNVDGTGVRRLTHTLGYDGGPTFSPDGTLIVYRAYHPSTPADSTEYRSLLAQGVVRPTKMDLWVMNADGSNQRQITHLAGASFAPAFYPGSKRIIFSSNYADPKSEHFDLFAVDLDGANLETITTDHSFNAFPMFSPDGKHLVWASNRGATVPHETNLFIADWVEHP